MWQICPHLSSTQYLLNWIPFSPVSNTDVFPCWPYLATLLGTIFCENTVFFRAGVGPVARFIGAELVPLKYRSLMTAVTFSENTVKSILCCNVNLGGECDYSLFLSSLVQPNWTFCLCGHLRDPLHLLYSLHLEISARDQGKRNSRSRPYPQKSVIALVIKSIHLFMFFFFCHPATALMIGFAW